MTAPTGRDPTTVDRSFLARWVSQIQEYVMIRCPRHIRITRLANSLQFADDGQVFATLRADATGLFFREWIDNKAADDSSGLNLVQARTLVEQCLLRRAESVDAMQ